MLPGSFDNVEERIPSLRVEDVVEEPINGIPTQNPIAVLENYSRGLPLAEENERSMVPAAREDPEYE